MTRNPVGSLQPPYTFAARASSISCPGDGRLLWTTRLVPLAHDGASPGGRPGVRSPHHSHRARVPCGGGFSQHQRPVQHACDVVYCHGGGGAAVSVGQTASGARRR
eukprot:1600558-Alexandrium_andersonii.AAC.1